MVTDRRRRAAGGGGSAQGGGGGAQSASWGSLDPETGEPRTAPGFSVGPGDEAAEAGAGDPPRRAQPFSPGELLYLGDRARAAAGADGTFTVTVEWRSAAPYNPEMGEAPRADRLLRWTVSARAADAIRRIAEADAAATRGRPSGR